MDAPTERIGYALKNFFKEAYFLSESSEYLLKENSAQGQSELTLTFTTDNVRNLCIEDVDGKKQRHSLCCGFTNNSKEAALNKAVDHAIFKMENSGEWTLHLIEMKTSVGAKTWAVVKAKQRASYLDMLAVAVFLGIKVKEVFAYTTYGLDKMTSEFENANIAVKKPILGQKIINLLKDEWQAGKLYLDFGDGPLEIKHKRVKMARNENESVLKGKLEI